MRRDRMVYIEGVADIYDEVVNIMNAKICLVTPELSDDLDSELIYSENGVSQNFECVIVGEDLSDEKFKYLKSKGIIVYDRVTNNDIRTIKLIREELEKIMKNNSNKEDDKVYVRIDGVEVSNVLIKLIREKIMHLIDDESYRHIVVYDDNTKPFEVPDDTEYIVTPYTINDTIIETLVKDGIEVYDRVPEDIVNDVKVGLTIMYATD